MEDKLELQTFQPFDWADRMRHLRCTHVDQHLGRVSTQTLAMLTGLENAIAKKQNPRPQTQLSAGGGIIGIIMTTTCTTRNHVPIFPHKISPQALFLCLSLRRDFF